MNLTAISAAFAAAQGAFSIAKELAPMVGNLYHTVRGLLPADSPGAAKMDAAKSIFLSTVAVTEEAASAANQAWPILQNLIELFHKDFKTRAAAAPASTSPAAPAAAAT